MSEPNNAAIVVAGRTHVYVAPKATAAPVDATTAMGAGWANLGYTTADSLSFSTSPEFENVESAQSDYPVRKFQTKDGGKVSVDLQEWTTASFQAVFGGGTVTVTSGKAKYVPPRIGQRVEVSCVIEVIDGGKHYRYVIPRCFQEEGVQSDLHKGKETTLPLRFDILGDDGVDAWYLLTDDPAFVASP